MGEHSEEIRAPEPLGENATEAERAEHMGKYRDAFKSGMTFDLAEPFKWGDGQVETLRMKPSASAFRGVKVKMDGDGGIEYEPHLMAGLCIRMAGMPTSATDRLSVQDMNALAQHGIAFFGLSRTGGRK